MHRTRLLIITLTLLTITGCAELYEQHMREICTPSGAYAEGANSGRDGYRMRGNLGAECSRYVPLTWEQQQQIDQSYIEGYQFGSRNRLINQGIDIFGKAITQDDW
jgi:hypothetical protein